MLTNSIQPFDCNRQNSKMECSTRTIFSALAGISVPIIIPVVQFGLVFRLWDKYNKPVDKKLCSCSCWDTVFKGGYETGVGEYKHFYFNSNQNTAIIWLFTVLSVIALYESVKHCFENIQRGISKLGHALIARHSY